MCRAKSDTTHPKTHRRDPDLFPARPRTSVSPLKRSSSGLTVPDAPTQTKREQDRPSTLRRSRREGICGSCAMNIDGANPSACLRLVAPKTTKIYPLPHMSVTKDPVPDLTNLYAQYKCVPPWLLRDSSSTQTGLSQGHRAGTEHRQSKLDRLKPDGPYERIPRARRSTSRPSHRRNSDKYLGPATPSQASRRIPDSRDTCKQQRSTPPQDPPKPYRRHTITNRSKTRPKHSNPGAAVAQIKQEMLWMARAW